MVFKLVIVFVLLQQVLAERCTTPNNEIGSCVLLYSCPALIKAISHQDPLSIQFVRLSNCGGSGRNPMVCCGVASNFTVPIDLVTKKVQTETTTIETVTKRVEVKNATNSLIPDRRFCGYQHSDDYFRENYNTSEINEFPWLAILIYKKNSDIPRPTLACSGSLINTRYVLTSAHCTKQTEDFDLKLTAVRLGEYNIKNETDCVNTTGIKECSDPAEDFGIEKIIIHPNFVKYDTKHDIALLRLNRTVTYTDYIRPICLPFPGTTFAKVGDTLLISGFGQINSSTHLAEIKKKIQTKYISDEQCAKTNGDSLTKDHFCTKDVRDNTEFRCYGDTGGPIIFSHKSQWHQEGIVSYGFSGCGSYFPNVHLKVKSYLNWIEANIEP
ncbi:hypothetical protein ILUMI_18402 [Ignelater luminosus]|uniref:CLIP domain-containing serine protease n=1 Tax=Ignelater luminosus TaxID=2038154 RepID=A0A8K0CMM0_IGNLU|nr:hypothetical protein ILUMI_18402 [Ignelater luminosus]